MLLYDTSYAHLGHSPLLFKADRCSHLIWQLHVAQVSICTGQSILPRPQHSHLQGILSCLYFISVLPWFLAVPCKIGLSVHTAGTRSLSDYQKLIMVTSVSEKNFISHLSNKRRAFPIQLKLLGRQFMALRWSTDWVWSQLCVATVTYRSGSLSWHLKSWPKWFEYISIPPKIQKITHIVPFPSLHVRLSHYETLFQNALTDIFNLIFHFNKWDSRRDYWCLPRKAGKTWKLLIEFLLPKLPCASLKLIAQVLASNNHSSLKIGTKWSK